MPYSRAATSRMLATAASTGLADSALDCAGAGAGAGAAAGAAGLAADSCAMLFSRATASMGLDRAARAAGVLGFWSMAAPLAARSISCWAEAAGRAALRSSLADIAWATRAGQKRSLLV